MLQQIKSYKHHCIAPELFDGLSEVKSKVFKGMTYILKDGQPWLWLDGARVAQDAHTLQYNLTNSDKYTERMHSLAKELWETEQ